MPGRIEINEGLSWNRQAERKGQENYILQQTQKLSQLSACRCLVFYRRPTLADSEGFFLSFFLSIICCLSLLPARTYFCLKVLFVCLKDE